MIRIFFSLADADMKKTILLLALPLCLQLSACSTLQNFGGMAMGTIDRIFGEPDPSKAPPQAGYDQAANDCKPAADFNACMRAKGMALR